MSFTFVRTLRTESSERFLVQLDTARDVAVLDIHYLANGDVSGTVVVLDHELLAESRTAAMLERIDEALLPMASLDARNLSFAIVKGELIGQFENSK